MDHAYPCAEAWGIRLVLGVSGEEPVRGGGEVVVRSFDGQDIAFHEEHHLADHVHLALGVLG